MSSVRDAQGNALTAASSEVAHLLDRAVAAYLGARADTRERLAAVLAADPDGVMARCLDGYLSMLSSKSEGIRAARAAAAAAAIAAGRTRATRRERLHVAALDAWSSGDMRAAAAHWDAILAEWPRDLVAIKVAQFVLSYLGETERMRETMARLLPAWDAGVPGYGFVLGCEAYALEEAGDYGPAEEAGRRAVELDSSDIWAAHAVAHVREMQGRLREGIEWISGLTSAWGECTNFAHHLRWHEGLFHLELEQFASVLQLYDREVRGQPSDEYLDLTNAVSLLWRLEQAGVDVGPRWRELAECARGHTDDHALVFADLHYLMALTAAGDADGVARFMESCERFAAAGTGTESAVMAEVGLPLAHAIVAHRRGAYGDVVDVVAPVRERVRLIGGSHAQRDVFDQLLIDAAWRGGRLDVAGDLLAERTTRRPGNRWGWRHRAAVLDALGAVGATDARRHLERLRGEPGPDLPRAER